MFLFDYTSGNLIGQVSINSNIIPSEGDFITVNDKAYCVQAVVFRMEIVKHMTDPRVDIYVDIADGVPDMVSIPPDNGIDKEWWAEIQHKKTIIEADSEARKQK